ncbi:MAG TPA: hypothetical protein VJ783_01615 [Pirellulales bacterium]|nr:hypothetical protein [Pirellulales bacterium]
MPDHLHTGNPTPWSEGCVVRFTPQSGDVWIGNLQKGYGYATKIVEWPEANALVVIAKGAVYLVRPDHPGEWTFIDLLGIDCVIAPPRDVALISTYTDVVAVSTDGRERWRRSVAIDGVEIISIRNGLVHGNAGIDPPDEWHPFLLALETGFDVEENGETEPPITQI